MRSHRIRPLLRHYGNHRLAHISALTNPLRLVRGSSDHESLPP